MKKNNFLLFACLVSLLCSCSIMCSKKTSFKDSTWVAEYQEFIADVGNADVTVTLQFKPGKNFVMTTESETPAHPAMFVNPDGSIDTLPGFSINFDEKGTYTFDKNVLTLNREEGSPIVLQWDGGTLTGKDYFGRNLVFRPVAKDKGK